MRTTKRIKMIARHIGYYIAVVAPFWLAYGPLFNSVKWVLPSEYALAVGDERIIIITVIMAPVYIGLLLLIDSLASFYGVYTYLTLRDRMIVFRSEISRIRKYHENGHMRDAIHYLTNSDCSLSFLSPRRGICITLFELLITDIRSAFQIILDSDDIRVSVYEHSLSRTGINTRPLQFAVNEPHLGAIVTTEFDRPISSMPIFKKTGETYEGFCGYTFSEKKPMWGNGSLIDKNRRFYKLTRESDRGRSFATFPVFDLGNDSQLEMILCVDSCGKYDLFIGDNNASILTEFINDLSNIMIIYRTLIINHNPREPDGAIHIIQQQR